jgi:hypothetical protein
MKKLVVGPVTVLIYFFVLSLAVNACGYYCVKLPPYDEHTYGCGFALEEKDAGRD